MDLGPRPRSHRPGCAKQLGSVSLAQRLGTAVRLGGAGGWRSAMAEAGRGRREAGRVLWKKKGSGSVAQEEKKNRSHLFQPHGAGPW